MKFDFKDKTVLVTGSSRGIGKVTAGMFAEAGAKVIIHYRQNKEEAEKTLNKLPGSGHFMVGANLEYKENIEHMMETIFSKTERVDILVNNAGIYKECALQNSTFSEWSANWERTIAINLSAVAHLSYYIGNRMIAGGGGCIVNISSRGAFRGEPNAPAYGASKAGLNALSQCLAKALAPHGIFVYAIAPGFVETEMAEEALSGPEGDAIRNQSPLGRVAKPEDVAQAVLMLASKGSEFMTGTIVDVNGASYLRM